MPTTEEYEELFATCDWKWTKKDGVNGYEFTSQNNGNKIIFPAAGMMLPTLLYAGFLGRYWSSSLVTGHPACAHNFFFNFDSGKN